MASSIRDTPRDDLSIRKSNVTYIAGEEGKEQRRFALRHLRDFGFGKYFVFYKGDLRILMCVCLREFGCISDLAQTGLGQSGAVLL